MAEPLTTQERNELRKLARQVLKDFEPEADDVERDRPGLMGALRKLTRLRAENW
jgi:hypothetical protein